MDAGRKEKDLIEVGKMYKGFTFTKLDIRELVTKDSNIEGTRVHRMHWATVWCRIE